MRYFVHLYQIVAYKHVQTIECSNEDEMREIADWHNKLAANGVAEMEAVSEDLPIQGREENDYHNEA